ncbi:MAG: DUF4920 domain-containing protein [Phycisphaerae bacterium]
MSGNRWILWSVVALAGLMTGCTSKYADFGNPMKADVSKVVPVAKVIADCDRYDGQTLRVKGLVSSVCAKKGCWLRMKGGGGDESVFVKFTCPVEGRLIPMDAVGHEVMVEGTLKVEEISEADARHYAEDSGKPATVIASIVGPQKQVRMMAPAARVYDLPQ